MAGTAARLLRSKGVTFIAIIPRSTGGATSTVSAAVEGAIVGLFDPDQYRTVDKEEREIDRAGGRHYRCWSRRSEWRSGASR